MDFAPKIDSPPHASNQSTVGEEFAPAALYGVHDRDGNVVTEPSKVDLDFLSAKYGEPSCSNIL